MNITARIIQSDGKYREVQFPQPIAGEGGGDPGVSNPLEEDLDLGDFDIVGILPCVDLNSVDICPPGLKDYLRDIGSTGVITPVSVTDNEFNEVYVSAGVGLLRESEDDYTSLWLVEWPELTLPIADNEDFLVYVTWASPGNPAGGAMLAKQPIGQIVPKGLLNYQTEFAIGTASRDATGVHSSPIPTSLTNTTARIFQMLIETMGFAYGGGLILGETGARYVTVTAGTGWVGYSRTVFPPIDTSV